MKITSWKKHSNLIKIKAGKYSLVAYLCTALLLSFFYREEILYLPACIKKPVNHRPVMRFCRCRHISKKLTIPVSRFVWRAAVRWTERTDFIPHYTTEFLKLACTEMTNKEIAEKMHLSVHTIDGYRDNLFEKLEVKSRIGLVLYALKNKIVLVE